MYTVFFDNIRFGGSADMVAETNQLHGLDGNPYLLSEKPKVQFQPEPWPWLQNSESGFSTLVTLM
jgi:hypothetical protein